MIPSNTLTLGGFLQGLQANMMGLILTILAVLIALLIVRWFINTAQSAGTVEQHEAASTRRSANRIAGVTSLLVVAIFCIDAAIYATNIVPRTGLDRTTINRDLDANAKR